ncbi:hypothetical protein [Flectobacillus sp. BAB-3569]|uniref:hypothetical protein n=1 Tax=Flectobacillus sp. BAB-3569 TaxID=1509483 RepID=UPI000BA322C8|nr:hypothetical protein [Flectobacillus sp. BAB-3569]PAC27804.1 hypothetical protein BWI92_21570 [Flectobacillus sp. BAB-3569]
MEGINRQTLFFDDLVRHIEKIYASNNDLIKGKFEGYRRFLEYLGLEYYPLGIVSSNIFWDLKMKSLCSNFTYVIYSEHIRTSDELVIFDSEYKLNDIANYDELKLKLGDLDYSFLHKGKISSDRFLILHKSEDGINFRYSVVSKDPSIVPNIDFYPFIE